MLKDFHSVRCASFYFSMITCFSLTKYFIVLLFQDQVADSLAKQEPQETQEPKSALSVPQIKVPQFKATHTVHLKMSNSSPHNKINVNGIEAS